MIHEPPYAPHEDDDTTTIDIESSIGWEPPENEKYRRIREDFARNDKTIWPWNSMLESRPANEWRKGADDEPRRKKREPADLFGTLWREGELAVLAGGTGVGKSILAVQIAEAIARGRRVEPFRPTSKSSPPCLGGVAALRGRGGSSESSPPYQGGVDPDERQLVGRRGGSLRGREVLYLDLQHTAEQFTQRYSVGEGRRRRRYAFSPRNIRTGVKLDFEPPEGFRGNLNEYLFRSIEAEIRNSGVPVVIIDSLAHLAPSERRLSAVMRTLRLWCAQGGYSILLVADTRARRRVSGPPPYQGGVDHDERQRVVRRGGSLRSTELADIPPQIAQFADSIFTLSPSTMREDVRYLKHLKSTSTPITLDHHSVAMYYLGRMDPAGTAKSSPPYPVATSSQHWPSIARPERGVAAAAADGVVLSSPSNLSPVTRHPSLSPFLGFDFVNFTPESDHLRNYAAEAQTELDPTVARNRNTGGAAMPETKRLKRIKGPRNTIEMLMSPEYGKYLKGE